MASFVVGTSVRASAQSTEAEAHADTGLELAQAGNLESAEAELRRAVELAPNDRAFLADLGTVLAMEKKLEESTSVFARALKLNPSDSTVRRYLAANQWQLHRYPEAKHNLEIILKNQPGDPQSLLLLGMVSENMKDYAIAARLLASVAALVRERPESIAALARSYYHTGEKEKARGTLNELELTPAGPHGVFLGAQIATEMQDYETAEKLLLSIQSSFPDQAALGYNLALVQYRAKQLEDSRQTLLHLIQSGYRTSPIYNLLGWCYHEQNQPEEAAGALEQAISLEPGDVSNYLDLGKILVTNHSMPHALEIAKRMTHKFPDSSRAFVLRGWVELKMSQFIDAIGSFSRTVQLDPGDPDGRLGLAQAQFGSGMTKEASASFVSAMKSFPKDARFPLEYAIVLLKEAETSDAPAEPRPEALLKSALALDGSSSEAHYQLGSLYLEKGQAAEALVRLKKASKLDPQCAKVHFALSRAYRRLGRKDEASKEMDLYQKLKEEEPKGALEPSPAGMSRN